MRKGAEDRAERILAIYSKMLQGQVIDKGNESVAYGVTERTIQRDISDIQCFLHNQNMDSGEEQEIIFDRILGGYRLETRKKRQLEVKELLAVCKVLLESRSLVKGEMFPIINKLVDLCVAKEENKLFKDFISNEMYHYIELQHGKKLLDDIWKLEEAVNAQRYLEIKYRKLKNQEVSRKVKPVGVMFSEYYFYLTAYIEDIDKEKAFQNPNDPFPTLYRVDRLKKITVLNEHFSVPYGERFEEGEFRKRIQFMYGGRLRRIQFKYKGNSLAFILDKLSTTKIISRDDTGTTFQAEIFGDGFDRWVLSQGDDIVDIKCTIL